MSQSALLSAGRQARLHADVHDPDGAGPQPHTVVHAHANLVNPCSGQVDAGADPQVAAALGAYPTSAGR